MLLIVAVFVASLLQSSTGFGFSIVGTPFLLMIYPAHTAIQINIILSLCLSVFMLVKIKNEIVKPLLARLIKGSIVMLAPGLLIYLFLDIVLMKIIVGGLILLLTVLLMKQLVIRQTKGRDYATGGVSGLLTTSIGVPGPPLLLYFAGSGTHKAALRGTTLAYYLFIYAISLGLQIGFGGTDAQTWIASAASLPALLLGIVCGQWLFKRFSAKGFKIVTYILLLFSGGYLIISSI